MHELCFERFRLKVITQSQKKDLGAEINKNWSKFSGMVLIIYQRTFIYTLILKLMPEY